MQPSVYIVSNRMHGTLYVGVTSNISKRVWEHKEGVFEGFSKTHGTTRLVWYEFHGTMDAAITREKQIKNWNRSWKIKLIEQENMEWSDLYELLNI